MNKETGIRQTLLERTRWLFTREGLPVLVSIVVGMLVGFYISGVVGLILATLAGFAVLKFFNRLPLRFKPWQAVAIDWSPVIGKLFFSMAFLLPIASYLSLPSGHTPNTIPKYLSIALIMPKNLFSKPSSDVFPGFVIIVVISIVLMYWGSMNLEKPRHWLLAVGGLLLYTFSPTISATLMGNPGIRILMSFFGVGYYFAWIGLLLLLASRFMPNFLKIPDPVRSASGMLNLLPPLIGLGILSQLNSADSSSHLNLLQLFDFESDHHFIAGIFSGGFAGISAGVIVGGEVGPPPEEPPDVPEEPPLPQGPQPYYNPNYPEGTTIEYFPDGSSIVRAPDGTVSTKYPDGTEVINLPDGTKGTKYPDGTKVYDLPDGTKATEYTDGTVYGEHPDGSKTTEYPDGTTKYWGPDGTTQIEKPNGDMEITNPDGSKSSVVTNPDGSIDITSAYGGTMHIPEGGSPEGSLTAFDGTKYTFNPDGSSSITSPYGGTLTVDKDGNMSGSFTSKEGDKITVKPDGSMEAKTAEGDEITVDAEGMKAKFKDGSYLNTDASGNPISGHVKTETGTIDIKTDDKGTTHIKDEKGNTLDTKDGVPTGGHFKDENGTIDISTDDKGNMDIKDEKGNTQQIKPDGSGEVHGPDANGSWDANGNADITTGDGTRWKAGSDGKTSIETKAGEKAEIGSDGGLSVTDKRGQTTTYTPEQVKGMSAEAGAMPSGGN